MRRPCELDGLSLAELERLYAHTSAIEVPEGRFAGRVLGRLENRGARRLRWRATQIPMFEWLPFGVDFDRSRWFFVKPSVLVGRFEARVERSRWRDTEVVTLRYEASRLPRAVKSVLYDEVKPLSDELLLGLGGVSAREGEGDHFFFALTRLR
ncbi:MAG: hypothetical protein M5U28_51215 [Sandaracinaceae bacterium]|nr:hypothetical protein [Sandaracinaceae bacterium]